MDAILITVSQINDSETWLTGHEWKLIILTIFRFTHLPLLYFRYWKKLLVTVLLLAFMWGAITLLDIYQPAHSRDTQHADNVLPLNSELLPLQCTTYLLLAGTWLISVNQHLEDQWFDMRVIYSYSQVHWFKQYFIHHSLRTVHSVCKMNCWKSN